MVTGDWLDNLTPADDRPDDPEAAFRSQVAYELHRLEVRDEAARQFALARRPEAPPFDVDTLTGILARPADPPMRVDGLVPWESSTTVVAQRKTGKTTLSLNLARALLTGDEFLDRFAVRKLAGTVAFVNFEVSPGQIARWARDCRVPGERLHLVNLRGRRNPFAEPADLDKLAGLLRAREVETVIVDPFGRAFTGESQNDAGQVGTWLVGLDRWVRSQVGARDLILSVHAGWNGERARGSTALEDWADSIITLTRDDDGRRYLRALGRDVDVPEDELGYDPDTRRLFLTGDGGRQRATSDRLRTTYRREIVDILEANPDGLSGNELQRLTGHKDATFTAARRELVAEGVVSEQARTGRGGGNRYVLKANLPNMPKPTEPVPSEPTEPPSIGGGSGSASSGTDSTAPTSVGSACPDWFAPGDNGTLDPKCPNPPDQPCPDCNQIWIDGPDRCIHCGWSVAAMGHKKNCPNHSWQPEAIS